MILSSLRSLLLVTLVLGLTVPARAATDALVFSLRPVGDHHHTLLVLEQQGDIAQVIDLSRYLEGPILPPLALVEQYGFDTLAALPDSLAPEPVPLAALTITPLLGSAHVAAATNYAEHQQETDSDQVFLFPKFGAATAGHPTVATGPGVLLDYEIEICAIFGRAVASLEDFESAVKGFYLCSDFTDRATLLRLMDIGDLASGVGFTDAKSGDDRFAVADRLVVPRDWARFLAGLPLTLTLNGDVRQQASGGDMLLKLDEIVAMALAEGESDRWRYGGEPVTLLEDGEIAAGQTVLTGTPGGVLMQIPPAGYLAGKWFKWLFTLAWVDADLQDFLVDEFVADSEADRTFLQPGDVVEMEAGVLGSVSVTVTD
jgi:2-keto-4-pentenoate hydratase/2-oxohepta-3-ene-1,7-dioic acid hydratase in catechol pathway